MRSPFLCTEIRFSRLQHCFLFLIVSIFLGSSPLAIAQGSWPMPGHDAQRTGRANYAGPTTATSSPSWSFSSGGPIVGDITTSAEGKLYFASDKLYALNPDGTSFVPAASIGTAATGPVVDDFSGLVYVAVSAADGGFDLLSFTKQLQGGTVLLHVPKPPFGGGISPLLLGGGAVYFVAGRFPGVAYAAGVVQWSNPVCPSESGPNTPFGVSANGPALSADGNSLFVMCAATVSAPGGLFRLDALTGTVIASTASDRNSTEPALDSLQHIRSGWQAFGGAVFCGDYLTWDSSLALLTSPSPFCDSTRFTTSRAAISPDGRSTVRIGFSFPPNNQLDAEGANNWIVSTDNSTVPNFTSLPSVDAAGNVFIGNTQGIQARSAIDGHILWSFTTGDVITTQPVIANGGVLYAGSSSGKVYAFNESPTPNSGTVYLTGAGGGFITVNLSSASVVARNGFTDSGAVSVSPDGTRSYVSGIFGLNVVDNSTNQVITTVPVGARPVWNAISPDGSRVYVTQAISSEVFVVDTATNSIIASILVPGPQRVAVAPDNSRVYVGSNGRGIAVIDPATNTISNFINILGANTTGIAFTPDSSHAYVGEINGPGLYFIDARTDTFLQSISLPALGGGISAIAASPDGKKIYAANVRTSPLDPAHNVFVLDTATNLAIAQIPVSFPASQMAITSDGANVLVGDSDIGALVVASMATDSVVETIHVNDPCCPVISGIGARPPSVNRSKITLSPAALSFFFQQSVAGPVAPQQIHLAADSAQVTFSSVASVSTDTQWMTVSASSISTPADITVAVDPANLQAGIYSGAVAIVSPDASNTPLFVPVTLTIAPSSNDQNGQFPPGQVGVHPAPGPHPTRLSLVPESSTAFSVLLEQDRTVVSSPDQITSDVTITNNWQAWYFVSVQPVGSVGRNLPSSFLIGPGGKRSYQLMFKRGDSIAFFADATVNIPPVSDQDYKLLSVYGAELLWRGVFGSPMPQDLADFALSVASKESPLVHLAVAAAKGDITGMTTALDDISGDPILLTKLTAFGLPIAEKVNLLKQAQRLFRILQFEIDELVAALKFPNDTLTITAK